MIIILVPMERSTSRLSNDDMHGVIEPFEGSTNCCRKKRKFFEFFEFFRTSA